MKYYIIKGNEIVKEIIKVTDCKYIDSFNN